MKKYRITLFMEEVPIKALKVMAASEGKTMSELVEDYVMGGRQSISDPVEIKRIEKKHNIVPNRSMEKEYKKDDPIFKDLGTPIRKEPVLKEIGEKVDPPEYCKHAARIGLCKYGC